MDWLNDIGNSVGGFFGGLFGGNDEKKKQEEERRKQEALQKQQAQAAQKPVTTPVIGAVPINPTLDMTDQRNNPLVIKRASMFDAPLKPTPVQKPLDAEGVEIEKRYQELLPSYKADIQKRDEEERSHKTGFDWMFHQGTSDEAIEKMARGKAASDYMYSKFDADPNYAADKSQSIQDILKENQAYFTDESKKANEAAKTTESVRRIIDTVAPFIPFGVGNAYSLIKAGVGLGMGARAAFTGDDGAMDFTHYMMDAYAGINASDFDKMDKASQDSAFFSAMASMPLDVFFSGKGLIGNMKAMKAFGLKGSAVEIGKQFFDNPAKFLATSAKNIVKNTGVGTVVGSGVNVGARLAGGQSIDEAVVGMIEQIPQTALNALKSSAAAEFGNRAEGLVGNVDIKTAIEGTGLKAQVDSIEDTATKAQVVEDIATKLSDGDATIKRQIKENLTAGATKPQAEAPAEAPVNAPVNRTNNLFDGKIEYGQDRSGLYRGENPETKAALNAEEINQKIAALPDENYISQVSTRFGVDSTTVSRLMGTVSKPELFNLLNQNAEFIKTAKNPDAAATYVINKARADGKAASVRGGVATPKVETVVDAQGNTVNKATGEIIDEFKFDQNFDDKIASSVDNGFKTEAPQVTKTEPTIGYQPNETAYHTTNKVSEAQIRKQGFKTGAELGTGEKRPAIYAFESKDKQHGLAYNRDGEVTQIPLKLDGLKILDRTGEKFTDQQLIKQEHVAIPDGYDGVRTLYGGSRNQIVLTPEAANKAAGITPIVTKTPTKLIPDSVVKQDIAESIDMGGLKITDRTKTIENSMAHYNKHRPEMESAKTVDELIKAYKASYDDSNMELYDGSSLEQLYYKKLRVLDGRDFSSSVKTQPVAQPEPITVREVNPDGTVLADSQQVHFPSDENINSYRTNKAEANSKGSGYVSDKSDIIRTDMDGNEIGRISYDKAVKNWGTEDRTVLANKLVNGDAPATPQVTNTEPTTVYHGKSVSGGETGDRLGNGLYVTTDKNRASVYAKGGAVDEYSLDGVKLANLDDKIDNKIVDTLKREINDSIKKGDNSYKDTIRLSVGEKKFSGSDVASARQFRDEQKAIATKLGLSEDSMPTVRKDSNGDFIVKYVDSSLESLKNIDGNRLFQSLPSPDAQRLFTSAGYDGVSTHGIGGDIESVIYNGNLKKPTASQVTKTEIPSIAPKIEVEKLSPEDAFKLAINQGNEWVKDYMYMGGKDGQLFFKHPETRETVIVDVNKPATWAELLRTNAPVEQKPVSNTQTPETPTAQAGFQTRIEDFTAQIRQLADSADEVLVKNGSSWEILSKKIQDAYATKTKPELTPKEAEIYSQYIRPTLDKVLGSLIDSGQVSKDVGQIEYYMPQAKKGSTRLPETIEDLYAKEFGYAKKRTGAIAEEDQDYGKEQFIDYVVRGSMSDDLQKQKIATTIIKENPDLDIRQVEAATEKRYEMINQIRTQVDNPNADANKIDSVTKLQEEAKILNITQDVNTAVPRRGLNADDALTSIGQMDNGFTQYRDATSLAQGVKDPAELHDLAVRLGLKYVSQARIDEIAERTQWLMDKIEPNEAQTQAIMSNAIRSMSVANVEGMIKKTNFIAPETRELVNREFNNLAIGYNKAVSTADKMMLVARRVMNSSMRDLNVNSALNEVNDIFNIITIYGNKTTPILSVNEIKDLNARWGYGDKIDLMDKPDVVNKVVDALASKDVGTLSKVFKAADTVEKKIALYHLVEQWKSAVFLKSAEDFYTAKGYSDIKLIEKVNQDYHQNYLPLDHFSRVISSDNQFVKLLTQYLDWNILKTRQEFRNLVGSNKAGKLGDLGRGGRVTRNLAMNIAPKIAVAMVRGMPIITALGILDPIGVFSQDYSGIQEEDKTLMDKLINLLGISPILSLGTQTYFNYRQDEEAKKDSPDNKLDDNRGDWLERSLANVAQMATPVGGQINRMFGNLSDWLNGRVGGEAGVLEKGYSENKNGRVQYLAPDTSTAGGVMDAFRGLLMGKNQTVQGREYAGNPDLISMFAQNSDANEKNNLSLTDWFNQNPTVRSTKEFFGTPDANYNRPLSNSKNANYSDIIKISNIKDEAARTAAVNKLVKSGGIGNLDQQQVLELVNGSLDRQAQEALLQGGRQYNKFMDDLRNNNKELYDSYVGMFDTKDFVNPEYWRTVIGGDANGNVDIATFKTLQARKQQAFKDLGVKYDPLYDLTDDQARAVLQQKSTATGDDIALRNVLYKSAWYVDYMEKSRAFWDGAEKSDITDDGSTQRVKDWNALNTQLFGLTQMDTPELQKQFPYTSAYKAAQKAYEAANPNGQFYGSPEATAWYSQYGNGYKTEQDAVDMANLMIINAMRKIEGFPEMSLDSYRQATEIYQPEKTGDGSGSGNYMYIPSFSNGFNATQAPNVKAAGGNNVSFNPNASVGRKSNSKITMKNY